MDFVVVWLDKVASPYFPWMRCLRLSCNLQSLMLHASQILGSIGASAGSGIAHLWRIDPPLLANWGRLGGGLKVRLLGGQFRRASHL